MLFLGKCFFTFLLRCEIYEGDISLKYAVLIFNENIEVYILELYCKNTFSQFHDLFPHSGLISKKFFKKQMRNILVVKQLLVHLCLSISFVFSLL